MPTDVLFLIGAGGHARVVLDALLASGVSRSSIQVRDDEVRLDGADILGGSIVQPAVPLSLDGSRFHVAVGDNRGRARLYAAALAAGGRPVTVIHPAAVISPWAICADGVFIAAGAIVAPGARIAAGSIVNHGAVADHDCVVGEFCHVAPGATLAGGVRLHERVLVGAGANILPGVAVASDATIGAGAVVRLNVPAGQTHVGVPARAIPRKAP